MESDGQVYRVSYDGKTDIADSSLRPTTKVLADPIEAQTFKTNMAKWEHRITAASKVEGLLKTLETLEASTQSEEKALEAIRAELETSKKDAGETAARRDDAARASAEAERLAKEAEKVRGHATPAIPFAV